MPITNGYTDQTTIKEYLRISSTDANDDGLLDDLVTQASRAIDTFSGRQFFATTATRKFDAPLRATLWLFDDLLSITTLTNGDGSLIASTSYVLRPDNHTPYFGIELLGHDGVSWLADSTTGSRRQAISVNATWGYAATTPADVELACLILAADVYRKRFSNEGEAGGLVTPDGVRILPAGFPSRVRDLLRPYRRLVPNGA